LLNPTDGVVITISNGSQGCESKIAGSNNLPLQGPSVKAELIVPGVGDFGGLGVIEPVQLVERNPEPEAADKVG